MVLIKLVCWGLICREKGDLKTVAATKVEQITAQLQTTDSQPGFDPVDRIKTGYIHFKNEKFESVSIAYIF